MRGRKHTPYRGFYLSPDMLPDSQHWEIRAKQAAQELLERDGREQYTAWVDKMPDDATWRDIYDLVTFELKVPTITIAQTESQCNCVLPEQSCPECRATARQMYTDPIPF